MARPDAWAMFLDRGELAMELTDLGIVALIVGGLVCGLLIVLHYLPGRGSNYSEGDEEDGQHTFPPIDPREFWLGKGEEGGQRRFAPPIDLREFGRDEIRSLLQKLADTPVARLRNFTAMCYESAAPPDRAEYVCPDCGERTVYTKQMVSMVEWDLSACRRVFGEFGERARDSVKLDESQFCRHFRPEVEKPELVLTLTRADGQHHVAGIDEQRLRILGAFLAGRTFYTDEADAEIRLKKMLPALEKLLGVKRE